MIIPHQITEDDVSLVLCDLIEVSHFFDHMDVVFLVVLAEFWLQDHEEVVALLALQRNALSVGGHLALANVDLPLDIASAVVEHKHIKTLLPPE